MKNVLITGANSYVGDSLKRWLLQYSSEYSVDIVDTISENWIKKDFTKYDVVFNVAGIAHADVGNVSEETEKLYYSVNTDLAVKIAEKAKASNVKQFIFMSSMIIYSGVEVVNETTQPNPENFYGDSKLQADIKIRELESESFKVAIIRPPMIYGYGSKGNYKQLSKIASKLPFFPKVNNKRSMIYINNFCNFVKLLIDNEDRGVFFPQNGEYSNTSEIVKMIAEANNHKIIIIPGFNWFVNILKRCPGKIGKLTTKAFGNFAYDMSMSDYRAEYRVSTLSESIILTECEGKEDAKQ